jgi:hypothetical protein
MASEITKSRIHAENRLAMRDPAFGFSAGSSADV